MACSNVPWRSRRRRSLIPAAAILLVTLAGAHWLRPRAESALRAHLEAEAGKRGAALRMEALRLGLWPPLRLRGVAIRRAGTSGERPASLSLTAESVAVSWRGRIRLTVEGAVLHAPVRLTVAAPSTTWEVRGLGGTGIRATLLEPQPGIVLTRTEDSEGRRLEIEADDVPLDAVAEVRRRDQPFLRGGTVRGTIVLIDTPDGLRFEGTMAANAARLPALSPDGSEWEAIGQPASVSLQGDGTWNARSGTLDIPRFRSTFEGAALSGALALRGVPDDPAIDLSLDCERVDFARLLRASGLGVPEKLGTVAAAKTSTASGPWEGDLGAASLGVRVQGRLREPGSFVVTQRLEFAPPPRMPPAVERLKGDFTHVVSLESGPTRTIDVSPRSADFIRLADVPPLFVRALLLAEDAGFYGHPGIDLREVPAAILTDIERGGAARGASTITQQLAKNLFLSHDKVLGRKLQEAACALLLEAALGKNRILEIYLNVIEWGPDLYGLRPAARTYFGKEPRDLTPAETAFLVSLIPAPVKYQVSFAHGTLGPGMRQLVDALLAKLRSVDALTEEDYRKGLAEEIVVRR
jgi:transglycosylase-like protein